MGVSPLGLVTAQSLSASIAKMLKTIHQNIWRQMSWGNCWRLQVEYPSFAPRVAYELSISSGKRWIHHLSASKAYTAAAFGFNHAPTDGRRSTWQPCRWPPGKVRAMSGNREWHLQKLSFRLQKPLELIAPGPDSLRSRADFWLTMGKCSGKLISIGQWALVSSYWLFSWLVDWMVSWLVGCLAAHSVGKNVILIEFRGGPASLLISLLDAVLVLHVDNISLQRPGMSRANCWRLRELPTASSGKCWIIHWSWSSCRGSWEPCAHRGKKLELHWSSWRLAEIPWDLRLANAGLEPSWLSWIVVYEGWLRSIVVYHPARAVYSGCAIIAVAFGWYSSKVANTRWERWSTRLVMEKQMHDHQIIGIIVVDIHDPDSGRRDF